MSGRAQAWIAAPAADPGRVASVRNTIDLTDAAALAVFGDRARRDVIACVDRLLAEVRGSDVSDCDKMLVQADQAVRGVDVAPLARKGWFGAGDRRRTVKARFDTADGTLDALSHDLSDRLARMRRRAETLEGLHEQAKTCILELDAYLDAGRAAIAGAPKTLAAVGEENAPVVQIAPVMQTGTLSRRLDDLAAVRLAAIRQLPLVRLVQNVDAPLAERLAKATDAIRTWRKDWRELLGYATPHKKIRPDFVALEDTRRACLEALDAVRRPLSEERARREEAERRMQEHAQTVRHAGG